MNAPARRFPAAGIAIALVLGATVCFALLGPPTGPAAAQVPARDDAAAFARGVDAYFADDFQAAWFFWLGPAERGFAEAQFSLGVLYLRGEGVPADLAIARRWFETAAAQGHAEARLNLAKIYDEGLGVPRDPVQAYIHAMRAANLLAGEERRVARDMAASIARRMTADEAERARRALMEGSGPRR